MKRNINLSLRVEKKDLLRDTHGPHHPTWQLCDQAA